MTQPLSIQIDQLSLPVASPREAARVARAMQAELERMFADDLAAGLAWRGSVDRLALELPEGRSCEETGSAIARAVRDRLSATDRAT